MTRKTVGIAFRIVIILTTVCLFAALLKRDYFVEALQVREAQVLFRSSEESYMGVYFNQQRIGYVKNRFSQKDEDNIVLHQEAYLLLNILGEQHPVRMNGSAHLNSGYLLKKFTFNLGAPFYKMKATGEVQGNNVHLSIHSGKEVIHDIIKLKKPPFFSTNRRSYLISEPLEVGKKIMVPYFDPVSLSGQNTIVQYKGKEKVLIQGRVYNLHHFQENFSGVRVNSWLNDQGQVIKEESPAGFIFLAEPEFKARDIQSKGNEILSAVSVPVSGKLTDYKSAETFSVQLSLPEGGDFSLNKDRQAFDGDTIIITREKMPEKDALVCNGEGDNLLATPYVQSSHEKISAIVQPIVEGKNAVERMQTITGWVFSNLEKRPVLGIPDALSTLLSRKGDCNEHAALFAAMARNAGVPTRIVAGVTYHAGAFYYHAWNEVCVGDAWISVDTTKNQIPADLSHIKFVEGEIAQQVKIGALLGKLKIKAVEYE